MTKIQDKTCKQIVKFLPDALRRAITTHQRFLECFDKEDKELKDDPLVKAKIFKARHDSCKASLAHIELLVKLAKLADLPDEQVGDETSQIALASMIENAAAEVKRYKE